MIKKEKLLAKLDVIKNMTDTEGVKQLVDVVMEIVETVDKDEMGFQDKKEKK